jgi:CubicO group peptidase (beta-lactamase class C family)
MSISRRACLRTLAAAVPAAFVSTGRGSAAEPSTREAAAIRGVVAKFLEKYQVPGLSVAFSHQEKIVFRGAYGWADESAREALTPGHRFRIASISKPLTAVAVFALVEKGKLRLDDKVFGPQGLLPQFGGDALPEHVDGVTVHHLLTHTSGGWGNDRDDPMFQHPEMNHDHPLKHPPGKAYAYSNFGYCLLGRVVEKTAGKDYAAAIREIILDPCEITDMKLAGNTLAERTDGEVVYHGRHGENPYNMNVERMESHGGWIGSPESLVKFLLRTDGSRVRSDLLREQTRAEMFRATQANPGYASGWAVNAVPNRWHGGSLPGTSTIAVTTASGLCWAGFANARAPGIAGELDRLMWDIVAQVPAWKA